MIGLACATLVLMALLGRVITADHGARGGLLYALGIAFGLTLYQTRFGFSAVFRQLGRDRQGQGVSAHLLMLAVASVLFAPLLANTHRVFGIQPHGFVYPLSVAMAGGAFLFGVGVQLGGGCMAGTLYNIGGGYVAMLLTLVGFAGGTVLGAWHWHFWTHDLPSLPPVSLAHNPWGYGGALLAQLAALGLIAVVRALAARWPRDGHPERPASPRHPGRPTAHGASGASGAPGPSGSAPCCWPSLTPSRCW